MSGGFLFDVGCPRAFHESETQQQEALQILRHRPLTKKSFEVDWKGNGCRLAPAIDMLRNGWGFEIDGKGKTDNPYRLLNRMQSPKKVLVTDPLKAAYYESEHWKAVSTRRFEYDDFRCRVCVGACHGALQCHHFRYRLFGEALDELLTVCTTHHEMIHDKCKLKFPTGMEVWVVERLTGVATYEFPEWLLP